MTYDLIGISKVAAYFGITIRAIRFYEDRGLIKSHRKTVRGARLLDHEAMTRLSQILELKENGLTIVEIREAIARAKGKAPSLSREEVESQLMYMLDDRARLDRRIDNLRARLRRG